jgi:hypothetical protein
VYAVNYDFEDPNFYLPAWVVVAMWTALGAGFALSWARSRGRVAFRLMAIACCAAAAQPLVSNYRDADESENHAVEDYARNVFASVDSNGVLFTNQSEILVSPSYYLQRVEGVRPDLALVDQAQVVGGHAWYFLQLEKAHPGFLNGARREVRAFTDLVDTLLDRMPLDAADSASYNSAYDQAVETLFRQNLGKRPVYATIDVASVRLPHLQRKVSARIGIVPDGLAFRFFEATPVEPAPRAFAFRPLVPGKGMVLQVEEAYAAGYTNEGAYQAMKGNNTAARDLLLKALSLRPGFPKALEWLQKVDAGGR